MFVFRMQTERNHPTICPLKNENENIGIFVLPLHIPVYLTAHPLTGLAYFEYLFLWKWPNLYPITVQYLRSLTGFFVVILIFAVKFQNFFLLQVLTFFYLKTRSTEAQLMASLSNSRWKNRKERRKQRIYGPKT